jgi:RES domain-containing protein
MCCPDCFRDEFLRDFVARNADGQGDCQHCGALDVPTMAPDKLAPYFQPVCDAYAPQADGRALQDLLQEDWGLFSSETRSAVLIQSILAEGATGTFEPKPTPEAISRELWERLKVELQEQNRFFPTNAPNREAFGALIANLVTTTVPPEFFRARTMKSSDVYDPNEMGAPPKDMASDGRANPFGISYLYLADRIGTAIAEVKPAKGALIAVCRFRGLKDEYRLIDLTDPKNFASPFRSTTSVAELRASQAFLIALGEELSVPTQPHRATLDYLASQYLCELIKVTGYDGVVYRSSVSEGQNFAFFSPDDFESTGDPIAYRVMDVRIEYGEERSASGD